MALPMPLAHCPTHAPTTLGDKLQRIAATSPADIRALDVLVSLIWQRVMRQEEHNSAYDR